MDICTNCNGRGNTGLFFWTKKCKECDGFGVKITTPKPQIIIPSQMPPIIPKEYSGIDLSECKNTKVGPKKKRKKRAR